MDKIKKALGLGDFGDYQTAIERVQREHEKHLREQEAHLKRVEYDRQRQMMNSAQNYASSGYQSGWNDPRVMMDRRAIPSRVPSVEELYDNVKRNNIIAKDLMDKIERTEKKVEMLTGFYTWVTEVHPEITAQHKAMRDLYEAANPTQTEAGP
jgi:hypothetical protein